MDGGVQRAVSTDVGKTGGNQEGVESLSGGAVSSSLNRIRAPVVSCV